MEKLTKRISARCTPAEYEVFFNKCKKANMTKAEFTRKMIFSSVVKQDDKEHKKRVLFLLNNVSNNCNQIAHHTNIHKQIDKNVLNNLDEILSFLKSIARGM
jgi:hypothetical protein